MTATLNLYCYMLGDEPNEIIQVRTAKEEPVIALKEAIIRRVQGTGLDIAERNLLLWKGSVPWGQDLKERVEQLNLTKNNALDVLECIGDIFPEVRPKTVHVIFACLPVYPTAILPQPVLRFFCYIQGDNHSRIFEVKIGGDETVYALKKAIKHEKNYTFYDVEPSSLVLWHVTAAPGPGLAERIQALNLTNENSLPPGRKLSTIFLTPPISDYVYLVVQCESQDDDVHLLKAREKSLRQRKNSKPPSESANPSVFTTVQEDSETYLACPRPPARESALPLTLFDPVFGTFIDSCSQTKPTASVYDCARKLKFQMNVFYPEEAERASVFRQTLSEIGLKFEAGTIADSNAATDGQILCGPRPLAILEVKNEIGSSKAEPSLQSLLYYETFIRKYEMWKDPSSIYPCFIITLTGPRVTFGVCALLDRCTMEMYSAVVLDFHDRDERAYDIVARHLMALKEACDSLRDRYHEYSPLSTNTLTQMLRTRSPPLRPLQGRRSLALADVPDNPITAIFPYPTSFTQLGGSGSGRFVSFKYTGAIRGWESIFRGITDRGQEICIKFVLRYGKEVHAWCSTQGFAPPLIGFEKLCGGWKMVVMEYLDESWTTLFDVTEPREGLKENIRHAVAGLHKRGNVHGDVRDTNIMVKKDGGAKFMLVDFDWAGDLGKAEYPKFINRDPQLGRPEDVRACGQILAEHDVFMVDRLL